VYAFVVLASEFHKDVTEGVHSKINDHGGSTMLSPGAWDLLQRQRPQITGIVESRHRYQIPALLSTAHEVTHFAVNIGHVVTATGSCVLHQVIDLVLDWRKLLILCISRIGGAQPCQKLFEGLVYAFVVLASEFHKDVTEGIPSKINDQGGSTMLSLGVWDLL